MKDILARRRRGILGHVARRSSHHGCPQLGWSTVRSVVFINPESWLVSGDPVDRWRNQVRLDSGTLPVDIWRCAVWRGNWTGVTQRGPSPAMQHDDDDDDVNEIKGQYISQQIGQIYFLSSADARYGKSSRNSRSNWKL